MRYYFEHIITSCIQSRLHRLFGKYGFSVSFQSTRLISFRKLLLIDIFITNKEQKIVVHMEKMACHLLLWQSIVELKLVGEVIVSKVNTNCKIISKNPFTFSDATFSFRVRSTKMILLIETNGISFLLHIQLKNRNIKIFSELSLTWDSYISIMIHNLSFIYLKNFYSTAPIVMNALLTYTKIRAQPIFFNASIKANNFSLTSINDKTIDKHFLLETLFTKYDGIYFTHDTYAPYKTIPTYLINAVIVAEDPSFWEHRGIDPYFVCFAINSNIKSKRFERGASTITMQLARNLFLDHDKNILRKIEESVIALLLENYFKIEKQDLLELYLNVIEFAPNIYGLPNASWFYFGKPYNELSLIESLIITYIIPRPKHFYEALLMKSEQLRNNLHHHIKNYANNMLYKKLITYYEYNNIIQKNDDHFYLDRCFSCNI